MTSSWTVQDSLALSVALVARDGHRMELRGAERVEAIRVMAAEEVSTADMADRLRMARPQVTRIAREHGIEIARPRVPWWVALVAPSQSNRRKAKETAAREDYLERINNCDHSVPADRGPGSGVDLWRMRSGSARDQ